MVIDYTLILFDFFSNSSHLLKTIQHTKHTLHHNYQHHSAKLFQV